MTTLASGIKRLAVFALAAASMPLVAYAAGEAVHIERQQWSFRLGLLLFVLSAEDHQAHLTHRARTSKRSYQSRKVLLWPKPPSAKHHRHDRDFDGVHKRRLEVCADHMDSARRRWLKRA